MIEIHGTLFEVECLSCGDRTPMAEALARVEAGEADPPCLLCGGILKSATISFGQSLDPATLRRAVDGRRRVRPADRRRHLAHRPSGGRPGRRRGQRAGARVVIVNAEPTPYDPVADAVVREPIGEALPALVS